MSDKFEMTAKTFQGLEGVLADELRALGAEDVTEGRRVVTFFGDKELLYRANFCLRTALRVLKPFYKLRSLSADDLYEQLKQFPWEQLMTADTTFAIDATVYSDKFTNSRFVTYRVKDAIADYFNAHCGKRPSIRLTNPELRFDVHISDDEVTLSLDSSGDPLYKRGWRMGQTEAPINEVLAAGIILLSGWHGECDLVDPMCGSGTFLIEAALIAANINPGVYRKGFAFQQWKDYDEELFSNIYNDDSAEREVTCHIYGSDIAPNAVVISQANVKRAGMSEHITVERKDLREIEQVPAGGMLISNPPYGERLETDETFYRAMGERLKHVFTGYNAWLICYNPDHFNAIGLKPSISYPLNNGGLDCELRQYVIFDGSYNELRSRGESIKNDDFRASEDKRRLPRREFRPTRDDDRGPRREFRPHRDEDRGPRREFRPRRDEDHGPRREFRPRRDEEPERPELRAQVFGDMAPKQREANHRYDNDHDKEFRHTEMFAKRVLRDRKPKLSADQEVPIVHGRRKSWKRKGLDSDK